MIGHKVAATLPVSRAAAFAKYCTTSRDVPAARVPIQVGHTPIPERFHRLIEFEPRQRRLDAAIRRQIAR